MAIRIGDIGIRAASIAVLAPAAVLATWAGGVWFLIPVLAACVMLSIEWATMSAPGGWRPVACAVALAVIGAVACAFADQMSAAFVLLVLGGLLAGQFAKSQGQNALDTTYGVLYIGWPVVLLIWLRDDQSLIGLHWTVLVFAVTWSADMMAYLVGSLVGGPKLWPSYSPNKTWSGFFGGLMAGMIAGGIMAAWLDMGRLTVFWGAGLGLAAAIATMAGDLWESGLKRRFGVKDTGKLIPGHGGLLDRVDGMMFAVVVIAAGRLIVLMLEHRV